MVYVLYRQLLQSHMTMTEAGRAGNFPAAGEVDPSTGIKFLIRR
jgi:hypothetical protein